MAPFSAYGVVLGGGGLALLADLVGMTLVTETRGDNPAPAEGRKLLNRAPPMEDGDWDGDASRAFSFGWAPSSKKSVVCTCGERHEHHSRIPFPSLR